MLYYDLQILYKCTTVKGEVVMKCIVSFLIGVIFIFQVNISVHAADISAEGVAIDIEIVGNRLEEGSIVSLTDGTYRLSTVPYDGTVFGIVTDNPAAVFKDRTQKNKRSVVTNGRALVRVSSVNGIIKKGDLIATSSIPGVGQKATENGYVIGVADEGYESNDPKAIDTIYVTLHLDFGMVSTSVRENLIASLRSGARAPFSSPLNALRYVTAGLIALLSFAGGFLFFGRISSRGVDAVARNPLARRFILLSIGLNVLITIAVMSLGVALAYMILII